MTAEDLLKNMVEADYPYNLKRKQWLKIKTEKENEKRRALLAQKNICFVYKFIDLQVYYKDKGDNIYRKDFKIWYDYTLQQPEEVIKSFFELYPEYSINLYDYNYYTNSSIHFLMLII